MRSPRRYTEDPAAPFALIISWSTAAAAQAPARQASLAPPGGEAEAGFTARGRRRRPYRPASAGLVPTPAPRAPTSRGVAGVLARWPFSWRCRRRATGENRAGVVSFCCAQASYAAVPAPPLPPGPPVGWLGRQAESMVLHAPLFGTKCHSKLPRLTCLLVKGARRGPAAHITRGSSTRTCQPRQRRRVGDARRRRRHGVRHDLNEMLT